jgi:hypothetical protein
MPLTKADFDVLARRDGRWLNANHFQGHIDDVVYHLNHHSPVAVLQRCRKSVLNKRGTDDTFRPYKYLRAVGALKLEQYKDHLYHYNEGGIDEMQFNFGMNPQYYRIGIGFSFSTYQDADVEKTIKHFKAFQRAVASDRRNFEGLIKKFNLRIEFCDETDPVKKTD